MNAVEIRDLVKRFGAFVAVDRVSVARVQQTHRQSRN